MYRYYLRYRNPGDALAMRIEAFPCATGVQRCSWLRLSACAPYDTVLYRTTPDRVPYNTWHVRYAYWCNEPCASTAMPLRNKDS